MKIHRLPNRAGKGFTTFGSVYAPGEIIRNVQEEKQFRLTDISGGDIPVQSRITAFWPDGSVKWAAHTADAALMGEEAELTYENLTFPEPASFSDGSPQVQIPQAQIQPQTQPGLQNTERLPQDSALPNDKLSEKLITIDTGVITARIPAGASLPCEELFSFFPNARPAFETKVFPVLKLESHRSLPGKNISEAEDYTGELTEITILESGPLQYVIRFRGIHKSTSGSRRSMPFCVFLYLWAGSGECRFVHTFFYDGDEQKDFLKGFGLRFETALSGKPYERHIQFTTDRAPFHESAALLFTSRPRVNADTYRSLLNDTLDLDFAGPASEMTPILDQAAARVPIWDRYHMTQHSSFHYEIRKQTKEECCELSCLNGSRSTGCMAVNGADGGLMIGIRDFDKKTPAGLEVNALSGEKTECYAWFYSPEAKAYDFRHYDTRSYPDTLYEGYPHVDASPYGIAVTSECRLKVTSALPDPAELESFAHTVQNPPFYCASPGYYHEKKAFGYFSLPSEETEVLRELEGQLTRIFEFYRNETKARDWTGLFDYGDVMHKYDPVRHVWRYDMGGFAWQNTELVPTYWLWLYFLRTGKEEVFDLAEAMARHCSEVDLYHFGKRQGIGTRHNVRHWGCPCKEPRVAMAGHHRFYYYLTGDYRIGDVMEEVKDADLSMKNLDTFPKVKSTDGTLRTSIRSGPDWTSFIANWMTHYERTLDENYLMKILNGIEDISRSPFGLASGPEYLLNEENGHLEYTGEHEDSINMHLQVCQGGAEIWLELTLLLDALPERPNYSDIFSRMLTEYGAFYQLSPDEKSAKTNGAIEKRPFSFPYFASALAAYSAANLEDAALARTAVLNLLHVLYDTENMAGFEPEIYDHTADGCGLLEIPWISTNLAAQWSLNTIVTLEFVKEAFPGTLDEVKELLGSSKGRNFHSA